MQVLQVMTRHMGIEAQATDAEVEELSQETAVHTLASELDSNLGTQPGAGSGASGPDSPAEPARKTG